MSTACCSLAIGGRCTDDVVKGFRPGLCLSPVERWRSWVVLLGIGGCTHEGEEDAWGVHLCGCLCATPIGLEVGVQGGKEAREMILLLVGWR